MRGVHERNEHMNAWDRLPGGGEKNHHPLLEYTTLSPF